MNKDLRNLLDDDCIEELQELIHDGIKAGFLTSEEIQEDCISYLEDNYPEIEDISEDMFSDWVKEFRAKYSNVGVQRNYKMLEDAFNSLEKIGIITMHFAGYTISDGFEDVNERATELHEKKEKVIGCCFYIQQDLLHIIHGESTKLYLTFGNYFESPSAEEIGKMVVEELKKTGFEVEWSGTADIKIAILNMVWDKISEDQI